jgi:hypothetical protein
MVAWRGMLVVSAVIAATGCGQTGGADAGPGNSGTVEVDATVQRCPRISSLGASPAQVSVGASLSVSAWAAVAGGGTAAFSWRAPSGRFRDAEAAQTTFECTAPGSVTLTCKATFDGCDDTMSVTVRCGP